MDTRGYSFESVQRALDHHVRCGRMDNFTIRTEGKQTFFIIITRLGDIRKMNLKEAFAYCMGLADCEFGYKHDLVHADPLWERSI